MTLRSVGVAALVLTIVSFPFLQEKRAGYGVADQRTREELNAARDAIWRAWFAFDSVALERLLPERSIAMERDTAWADRARIISDSRAFARNGGKLVGLSFPKTDYHVFGDVAVMYTVYEFETEHNGQRTKSSGQATELFVRRNRVWQNPSWHLQPFSVTGKPEP